MYTTISSQNVLERSYEIQMTNVKRQDNRLIHLWDQTEHTEEIFTIKYHETRPYVAYDNASVAVSFLMNMNLTQIEREVYSTLDMFGDVGGL